VTATGVQRTEERGRTNDFGAATAAEVRELVQSLIAMMASSGITELDLAVGDFSVRLRGRASGSNSAQVNEAATDDVVLPAISIADDYVVTAPMIGTYYSAPSPGDPPFVRVGDAVEVGQVVGIIEAMKIMNEILADRAGTVAEVLVANGQPVEYGSPLIRLSAVPDLEG
jgi:acetyl-CoA carboxylase biotin carboxyl carrier protein